MPRVKGKKNNTMDVTKSYTIPLIAGVDEAGRGPLAGPVVAAAVILDPSKPIMGLADSKKLDEAAREALFDEIRVNALAWAAARATVHEINEINILRATFLAMQRAVSKLKVPPSFVIVDGNMTPGFACPSEAIIKGDDLEPAISAASIVAKVLRDRIMMVMDKYYPDYGFAKHKGYSTQQHLKALKAHGACRIHRKYFAPVAAELGINEQLSF